MFLLQVLKSYLALDCGIPMHSQRLYLGEEGPLLDPMSLLDYPQIDPREHVIIRVEGEIDDASAKK